MGEVALFLRIHSGFSRHDVAGSAGFHFNKTQRRAVPPNEIKLTAAARAAVIASNDHIATFAQMEVSRFFATASGMKMLRARIFARQESGKGIESVKREAG